MEWSRYGQVECRNKVFLLANMIVPILTGAVIYYVTSPDVIFVRQLDTILGMRVHMYDISYHSTIVRFIRYYALDMLWGYALVFALYFILDNNTASLFKIFVIAYVFSVIIEILQLTSFVKGTFDVFDLFVELIAEIAAVFIIKNDFFRGGTKEI